MNLQVRRSYVFTDLFVIEDTDNPWNYLFRNGEMVNWFANGTFDVHDRSNLVYYTTEKEAQDMLDKFNNVDVAKDAPMAMIVLSNCITMTWAGELPKVVHSTHPNFNQVRQAIVDRDWNAAYTLSDIPKAISTFVATNSQGKAEVVNGEVLFEGEPVHNLVSSRILQFMSDGLPFEPLLRFLEKLMQNPSFNSREQLYGYLEHASLQITEDGDFLGYKAVNPDYTDKYSGTIDNSIGATPEVPRHKVDDNPQHDCSNGLHVGSVDYVVGKNGVGGFAADGDQILLVKVNPADVVSVPSYDVSKLRTCRYHVVNHFTQELLKGLYNNDGTPYDNSSGELSSSAPMSDDEFWNKMNNRATVDDNGDSSSDSDDYYDDSSSSEGEW